MDREEPGSDQREQRVKRNKRGRSPEEWEQIALKVLLLDSQNAILLRDHYCWEVQTAWNNWAAVTMEMVGVTNVTRGTFCAAVAKALRRLAREARIKIQQEREHDYRDKQR